MLLVFMYRLLLAMLGFCLVTPLFASDFGVKGLIDIPTARMSADGTLTTTAAVQSLNQLLFYNLSSHSMA